MIELKTDFRPAASLQVGVTGHRLNKLVAEDGTRLAREICRILPALRRGIERIPLPAQGGNAPHPALHVISALAEGADRIVAEAALDQGIHLTALLPFSRDDYAADFAPDSRAGYRMLLERATEVIEMNGRHDTEQDRLAAYAALGVRLVEFERYAHHDLGWRRSERRRGDGGSRATGAAHRSTCPVVADVRKRNPANGASPDWRTYRRQGDDPHNGSHREQNSASYSPESVAGASVSRARGRCGMKLSWLCGIDRAPIHSSPLQ